MEILIGIGTALSLAMFIYLGKWKKGESFQPYKLIRTLVVGTVIGLIAYKQGYTLTAENYIGYVGNNASAVFIADQAVKIVYRLISSRLNKSDG